MQSSRNFSTVIFVEVLVDMGILANECESGSFIVTRAERALDLARDLHEDDSSSFDLGRDKYEDDTDEDG